MIQAETTTVQPVPPATNRPVERSSRLSNGVIPLVVIILVIAAARRRRRRAAEAAARAEPPPAPPG